jgi:hypothetical protein
MVLFIAVLLCIGCSSRHPRHGWPSMNWDIQRHIFESRAAWDEGTGRRNDYEAGGSQLAR